MLPLPCGEGATLRMAKELCRLALHVMSPENLQIVLSVPAQTFNISREFADLCEDDRLSVRETQWDVVKSSQMKQLGLIGTEMHKLDSSEYLYPNDNGHCFRDCDAWIVLSERTEKPIAPLRPYAIVTSGFVQRYVPEVFGDHKSHLWRTHLQSMQRNLRNAALVVGASPKTCADAVSYGGVFRHRIRQILPLVQDYNNLSACKSGSPLPGKQPPYFLWVTSSSAQKNHLAAIEALKIYYDELDGQLRCLVVGPQVHQLRKKVEIAKVSENTQTEEHTPEKLNERLLHAHVEKRPKHDYVDSVRRQLNEAFPTDDFVKVAGFVREPVYWQYLRQAKFVWNPAITDNDTLSMVESAALGTPVLSSDNPHSRYLDNLFDLRLKYFQFGDPVDSAAMLKRMETEVLAARPQSSFALPADYLQQLSASIRAILLELLATQSVSGEILQRVSSQ